MTSRVLEFLWISQTGAHGMARPDAADAGGYEYVRPHPFYSGVWLCRREAPAQDES